jgi:hypothetical protein
MGLCDKVKRADMRQVYLEMQRHRFVAGMYVRECTFLRMHLRNARTR